MSVEAIAWVLNDAPGVKPHWVSTLVGLANHAGPDGRGAYPSQARLAAYTRKSDRAIRKDLAEMEAAGLIRRGDQRLVGHVPQDRRPVVFDIAMTRVNDLDGRNHSSGRKSGSGRNSSTERAEPQFRTGRNHSSDKPSNEPSLTKDTPDPAENGGEPRSACEHHARRLGHPHANCRGCGTNPRAGRKPPSTPTPAPLAEVLRSDGHCPHGAPPGVGCALCRRGIPAEKVS